MMHGTMSLKNYSLQLWRIAAYELDQLFKHSHDVLFRDI